jgi:hypothetical protein
MSSILQQLAQFIQEDPADPFNHYAYAVELSRQDPATALLLLVQLQTEHPDYLPTYYTAASLAHDAEDYVIAQSLLETGMDLAQTTGNTKTYLELQRALANVRAEME